MAVVGSRAASGSVAAECAVGDRDGATLVEDRSPHPRAAAAPAAAVAVATAETAAAGETAAATSKAGIATSAPKAREAAFAGTPAEATVAAICFAVGEVVVRGTGGTAATAKAGAHRIASAGGTAVGAAAVAAARIRTHSTTAISTASAFALPAERQMAT